MSSVDSVSEIVLRDETTAIPTPPDSRQGAVGVSPPPTTSSEDAVLDSRDVLELSAFVEKKNWIEEKIEFLRGLRHIDCFMAMIPSFPDTQLDSTSNLAEHEQLPTYEDLENMYDEQDRIEEEALIFDAGDLVELRKMARAASKKSLSREDTDLLSITLSTLYLLDTLMHLLRARADTIDLLSYRLEWDSLRFALAKEFLALERDMETFVREKARWSNTTCDAPSIGDKAMDEPSKSIESIDESVRAHTAIGKGATRSQRILFAQILELDFQAFRNRIANLCYVSIPQLDKSLTGMIDQAARLQSYHGGPKITSSSSSQRDLNKLVQEEVHISDEVLQNESESEGAVPNFFLDEQDILEDRVGVLGEWEIFIRGCIQQWKHVDKLYYSLRKILVEATNLSNDISQSISSHPSIETSKYYSDRVSAISSELSQFTPLRDDPAFLCLSHPAFPDQKKSHDLVVRLLDTEFEKSKEELSKIQKLAGEYNKLAEQVVKLDKVKSQLDEFTQILKRHNQYLLEGSDQDEGGSMDFSSLSWLQPGSYAGYIAQLPRISADIDSIRLQSAPYLKEVSILLLVLKQYIGIDPAFRSSVEVMSDSFLESLSTAGRAEEIARKVTNLLLHCRELNSQLNVTAREVENLHEQLSDTLERVQWKGLDHLGNCLENDSSSASFESRFLEIDSTLSGSLATSLSKLTSSASSEDQRLKKVIQHISSVFKSLCIKSDTLQHLLRTTSRVEDQAKVMNAIDKEARAFFEEASSLDERVSSALDSVLNSAFSNDHLALLSEDVSSFTNRAKSLVSSISQRVPLVSSPKFINTPVGRAVSATPETFTISSPPFQNSNSQTSDYNQPFIDSSTAQDAATNLLDTSAVDCLVRGDANTLAARLTSAVYDAEKRLDALTTTMNLSSVHSKETIGLEEPQLSPSQAMSSSQSFPPLILTTMESEILNIEQQLTRDHQQSPSIDLIALKSSFGPIINQRRTSTNTGSISYFREAVARCDDSLSALLDRIDLTEHRLPLEPSSSRPSSPSNLSLASLEATFSKANAAFQLVLSASREVSEDRRVASDVKRLTTAMEEMRDIIDAKIETSTTTSGRTSRMSMREDPDSEDDSRSYSNLSRSCSIASIGSIASSRSSRSSYHNPLRSSLTHSKFTVPQPRSPPVSSLSGFPDFFSSKARISRSSSASSFISLNGHSLSSTISSASKSRVNGESPPPVVSSRRQVRSTSVAKHTVASSRKTLNSSTISPPRFPVHQLSPPPSRTNSSLPVSSRYKSPSSQPNKTLSPSDAGSTTSSQHRMRRSTTSVISTDPQELSKNYPAHQSKPTGERAEGRAARRKPSVPRRDDTLDRAINKIVNDLKVEIPIEPHVRSDGVTEAGKYWIGIPPKLCFCRILRSKTVMVRVGGGWVELSKFLQDHFGYELPPGDSLPLSPALPEDAWLKGNQTSLSPSVISTPRRSGRQSLPLPTSHQSMTLSPSLPPHTPKRRESSVSSHPPTFVTPRTIVASVSSSSLNSEDQSSSVHSNDPSSPLISLSVITRYNPGELSPLTPKTNAGRKHSPSPRPSLEPILGLGIRVPKPRLSSTGSFKSLNGDKRSFSLDTKVAM